MLSGYNSDEIVYPFFKMTEVDSNITEEQLLTFFEHFERHLLKEHRMRNFTKENSSDKIFNVENCDEYCDSQMRHLFKEYEEYHGYVTLVVSCFNKIKVKRFQKSSLKFC